MLVYNHEMFENAYLGQTRLNDHDPCGFTVPHALVFGLAFSNHLNSNTSPHPSRKNPSVTPRLSSHGVELTTQLQR